MPTQLDHYRLLGRSGLRVSPLSLGAMTFGVTGGWGSSNDEAKAIVDHYVDQGGNFIDTANFYGNMGGSETVLAPLIKDRRERIVLATKYSITMCPGDPNGAGNQRKNMVQSVEASLKRLGTDYIDLLYLHMWDSTTPVDEVLRGFDDLIRAGKVVYGGLSDIPAWQASRMQAIAELRGWSQFIAMQISYSLLERTVERELIPMAHEMGMGVLPWSPLGGGVLSGKYATSDLGEKTGSYAANAASRKDINVATGRLNAESLAIAAVVGEVAKELGRTSAQVALAWTLLNPAVTSPIMGVRTLDQLKDNLGALDVEFTPEQIKTLHTASAIVLGFPHDILKGASSSMYFGNVKIEARR